MKKNFLLPAFTFIICAHLPLEAQPPALLGDHTITAGAGTFHLNIMRPQEGEPTDIVVTADTIRIQRMPLLDILRFLAGMIEPCLPEEACSYRQKEGEPYFFNKLEHGNPLQEETISLSISCTQCTNEEAREATLSFLLDQLSLSLIPIQVSTYSICQNVPAFLAHFHSGEGSFAGFEMLRFDHTGDYLEIRNASLNQALRYLSQQTNSLFKFNEACKYFSRAYTKPFRILLQGSPEEVITDFAQHHFLKAEKISGESWEGLVLKRR